MPADPAAPLSIEAVAILLRDAAHRAPFLVGVTGSVAVGKSTLCAALVEALCSHLSADVISTDGFLFANHHLEPRGLLMRKGFPETYDAALMRDTLGALRLGAATVPGYSHTIYDIDPALARDITAPQILFVEGLGLAPTGDDAASANLDLLIYIDASENDLESWFLERFMRLWHAAEHDEASFYRRFRHMSVDEARAFGRTVWIGVNLPNLREHIIRARAPAQIVLHKSADHTLHLARARMR